MPELANATERENAGGDAPAARRELTASQISKLSVKDGEESWTKAEVDEVLADLDEHRERITGLLAVLEREVTGLMKDAGDGAGHDQADIGSTTHERDQDLQLLSTERANLEQVDGALERIADGTFGVCAACTEPIGKMRVMAFPRARLCLPCKQREERR